MADVATYATTLLANYYGIDLSTDQGVQEFIEKTGQGRNADGSYTVGLAGAAADAGNKNTYATYTAGQYLVVKRDS